MPSQPALIPDQFYHIYHRGNNRESIFFEEKNYRYFLKLYAKYIEPVAFTYAYCLLNNHFHFCIHTKTEAEQREYWEHASKHTSEVLETSEVCFKVLQPSQQFSNLFNSYAKSINKAFGRTGSLFENKFRRKPVTSEQYFYNLIIYIHRNPQTHGMIDDFREWPWSSYQAILLEKPTRLARSEVLDWYGSRQAFQANHAHDADETLIAHLIFDE